MKISTYPYRSWFKVCQTSETEDSPPPPPPLNDTWVASWTMVVLEVFYQGTVAKNSGGLEAPKQKTVFWKKESDYVLLGFGCVFAF